VTAPVTWDPGQYLRYGDERARPFAELVARIGAVDPRHVVDLGCGPGNATAGLLHRWPNAAVTGVDSSSAMIAEARQRAIPGRLRFEAGDVCTWRPPEPVDVIVSNATFQWVPEHVALFPELIDQLHPGGWFAFQVPGNFGAPSHVLLREVGRSPRWRDRIGPLLRDDPVCEPGEYQAALSALGCETDVWETTYLHVLQRAGGPAAESGEPGPERPGGPAAESGEPAPHPVLEWVRGTALRPVLAALQPDDAAAFEAEYAARLRMAYPPGPAGTIMPFRRIFAVARRP
jgi:trans-aconitate 2-methyltransferase